jgi:hypothetical protein
MSPSADQPLFDGVANSMREKNQRDANTIFCYR